MKKRFYHILILTFAVAAAVSSAYAQDHGVTEFEITDSEKDRVERDKILYSPGEGDSRYMRSTPSGSPSGGSSVKEPVLVKEPAKDQEPSTKTTPPAKPKQESQPTKSAEKQPAPKGNDDEILSFNFLYYIIQKYKLQDIID